MIVERVDIMSKEIINLREELMAYRFEFDVLQKVPCSKQENKEYKEYLKNNGVLPEGVYAFENDNGTPTDEFYTVAASDLSKDEIQEYLSYKKLSLIKTIKNCTVFFTVLVILGLLGYFLLMMNAF